VNVHLKPGPELEKARREVAGHQRFAGLVDEVTAVSEAICAARPLCQHVHLVRRRTENGREVGAVESMEGHS
jgi:hypothetical protein